MVQLIGREVGAKENIEQLVFGKGADNYLENNSLIPFRFESQIDGNFSTELLIYNGSLGLEIDLGLDRVFVVDVQRANHTYLLEFWAGGTDFINATRLGSFPYRTKKLDIESSHYRCKTPQIRGDLKIWGRLKCSCTSGTSWIDILFEMHKDPSDSGSRVEN